MAGERGRGGESVGGAVVRSAGIVLVVLALGAAAGASAGDVVPSPRAVPGGLILDSFDRANANPLSDGGKWANGVNGSGETGHYVTSNQLACSRSTTCTAWRSNALYGPDVEVSLRIATLAGTNNHIRLKARLQQVGSAGYDGYMLRTNELSGTDEIYLERVDNGAFVRLQTIREELAPGDTLLLRVEGSTLEAWRKRSSLWTRLASVTDTPATRAPAPWGSECAPRRASGRLRGANAPLRSRQTSSSMPS